MGCEANHTFQTIVIILFIQIIMHLSIYIIIIIIHLHIHIFVKNVLVKSKKFTIEKL